MLMGLRVSGFVFAIIMMASFAHAQKERHFAFTYNVEITDLPESSKKVEVWLPVPPETPEQKIKSVTFDSPVVGKTHTEPSYGNRIWHAQTTPPLNGTLSITQRIDVVRKEQSVDRDRKLAGTNGSMNEFLKENRLVPLTPRFRQIALEETKDSEAVVDQARALYDYVMDQMAYDKSGKGWGRGDANYACDIRKGNCTDYHSLFIALERSLETPARFWIGFPLPEERGKGTVNGYHCWAEFWVRDVGWMPVDISEADKHPERTEYFFGNVDENRIVFTVGRDLTLEPAQQGESINFFVYPYVEVDGKPWARVDTHFSYQDLD